MLSVKLVVVGGEAKTKELQLKLPTTIGRGREGVTLTLPHKLVSRKHTELFEQEGQLYVKDLGSLNGTYVNNKRIAQRTLLKPNELLTLGNVTFRAVYDLAGVEAAPEVPEFQEVETPETAAPIVDTAPDEEVLDDVLNDEKCDEKSDTNKSLIVSPADLSDEALAEAEAALSAESVVTSQADMETVPVPVLEAETPESESLAGSSDIFSGPILDGATPDKSICINALDGLPSANKSSEFEIQLNGLESLESIKQVEIDLDEPAAAASPKDSRLGSFLKKMPR